MATILIKLTAEIVLYAAFEFNVGGFKQSRGICSIWYPSNQLYETNDTLKSPWSSCSLHSQILFISPSALANNIKIILEMMSRCIINNIKIIIINIILKWYFLSPLIMLRREGVSRRSLADNIWIWMSGIGDLEVVFCIPKRIWYIRASSYIRNQVSCISFIFDGAIQQNSLGLYYRQYSNSNVDAKDIVWTHYRSSKAHYMHFKLIRSNSKTLLIKGLICTLKRSFNKYGCINLKTIISIIKSILHL